MKLVVYLNGEQKLHIPVDVKVPDLKVGETAGFGQPGSMRITINGTVEKLEVQNGTLYVYLVA
jgi:hypothetical protein